MSATSWLLINVVTTCYVCVCACRWSRCDCWIASATSPQMAHCTSQLHTSSLWKAALITQHLLHRRSGWVVCVKTESCLCYRCHSHSPIAINTPLSIFCRTYCMMQNVGFRMRIVFENVDLTLHALPRWKDTHCVTVPLSSCKSLLWRSSYTCWDKCFNCNQKLVNDSCTETRASVLCCISTVSQRHVSVTTARNSALSMGWRCKLFCNKRK